MALLEQTDMAQSKVSLKEVVIKALQAKPDINMAELARVLGMKDGTVRQIKNRFLKN